MLLRITIIVQTVLLFAAPVTAGLLLTVPSGRTLHSASAYAVFTVTLLHLIITVLMWRPGGGSARAVLPAAGIFVLTLAQIALGIAGLKTLHVPLGVLLFAGSLLHLARLMPARRPSSA